MVKTFDQYTRITGSHGMRGSLWRGPDHLLVIEGKGFLLPLSEHYRRIDYLNIQALSLVRTSRYVWLALLLAVLAALLGLGFYAARDEARWLQILSGAPFTLMFVLLVLHLMRGPTCRCTLQTAVMTLRLRPLKRARQAEKVLSEIEQLCLQHQAGLPPIPLGGSSSPALHALPQIGMKPLWPGCRWLLAAGLAMVVWGAVIAGELFVPGMPYLLMDCTLGLLALLLLIIALVRAHQHRTPGGLLGLLWGSMALQIILGLGAYIGMIAVGIAQNLKSKQDATDSSDLDPDALFGRLADLSFAETGNSGWGVVLLGGVLLVLGASLVPYSFVPRALRNLGGSTPPPEPPQFPQPPATN